MIYCYICAMLLLYILPLHLYLEVWHGWQCGSLYCHHEEGSDSMSMVEQEGPWLILPLRAWLSHCHPAPRMPMLLTSYSHVWRGSFGPGGAWKQSEPQTVRVGVFPIMTGENCNPSVVRALFISSIRGSVCSSLTCTCAILPECPICLGILWGN